MEDQKSVDLIAVPSDNVRRSISASGVSFVQKENSFDYKSSSPTESSITAPSMGSTLYETPFTSLSGFDVYMSANEEIASDTKSEAKLNSNQVTKVISIPCDVDTKLKQGLIHDVKDSKLKQGVIHDIIETNSEQDSTDSKTPTNMSPEGTLKDTKLQKGKGGERIGDSGKCTPKKSLPVSPKSLKLDLKYDNQTCDKREEITTRSSSKDTLTEKSHNGSLKTPSSVDDQKHTKWGLIGGTRALLIQKVGNYFVSSMLYTFTVDTN